jgi:transposase-like protein
MRNQDATITNTETPTACPACGARDLTTVSKTVDVSTYWRCVKCGEVWNVSRRASGQYRRYGVRRDSW